MTAHLRCWPGGLTLGVPPASTTPPASRWPGSQWPSRTLARSVIPTSHCVYRACSPASPLPTCRSLPMPRSLLYRSANSSTFALLLPRPRTCWCCALLPPLPICRTSVHHGRIASGPRQRLCITWGPASSSPRLTSGRHTTFATVPALVVDVSPVHRGSCPRECWFCLLADFVVLHGW